MGAWVLGIPLRRAAGPILLGIVLAGVVVTVVYYLVTVTGIQVLRIFIKA